MGLLTGVLSLAREPARLTLRVWELGLSSAASVAKLGLELLEPERAGSSPPRYSPPPPAEAGNGRAERPVDVPPVADSPPAVPDQLIPDHVDEEVVLVAEVAEEGAEGGAGPELHVDEPWDGYNEMTAPEIRDRLAAGNAVLAAAVDLYETTHKSRRTVIEAAERALRS
ncbi:MAG TPA: hypothetical protein VK486_08505 [Thermoleophilaceae bacterium]|nr:hypothetical protein [Thermoleophilaceae bacterium]